MRRHFDEFRRRHRANSADAISAGIRFAGESLLRYFARLQSWKFGHFGKSSLIGKVRLLSNPSAIFIGDNVTIRRGARLEAIRYFNGRVYAPRIEIGDNTFIEFDAHIACANHVQIGKNVLIATRVFICDHNHTLLPDVEHPINTPLDVKSVTIGDGCWLGEGVAILPGVQLGPKSIVGTGAVVTRSFPAGSVLVGVPARRINSRDNLQGAHGKQIS